MVVLGLADLGVEYARTHTPAETRRYLERLIIQEQPESEEVRHQKALADRRVTHEVFPNGIGCLTVTGAVQDTHRVWKSLVAAAKHDKSHAEPEDHRTLAQHSSDLLLGMLLDAATTPTPNSLEESLDDTFLQWCRDRDRSSDLGAPRLVSVDAFELGPWHLGRRRHLRKLLFSDPDQFEFRDESIARRRAAGDLSTDVLPIAGTETLSERQRLARFPISNDLPDEVRWGPSLRGRFLRAGLSPVQINVTIDDATLRGLADNPALVDGAYAITAGAARQLIPQSDYTRLLLDRSDGSLLERSPHTYRPNRELQQFVSLRDPVCIVPGCEKPSDRCDLDHHEPFNHKDPVAGGTTTSDNLGPLCRSHHLLRTHFDFDIKTSPDGTRTWITPLKREYEIEMYDHRSVVSH